MYVNSTQHQPTRGLWKNEQRYYHFTADRLTIADFQKEVPTISFTHPKEVSLPCEGWEKVTLKQFNQLIDSI